MTRVLLLIASLILCVACQSTPSDELTPTHAAGLLATPIDPALLAQQIPALITRQAQIAAGADTIGIGDAIASQVSPDIYDRLIQPREKKLVRAIQAAGGLVRLHICGNITHLLAGIADLGVNIGPSGQQRFDRLDLPGARCRHQRRFAARKRGVRIRPGLQQQLDHRSVPVLARQRQRRHSVPVGGLHIGARANQ